jgi:hypothetical protein
MGKDKVDKGVDQFGDPIWCFNMSKKEWRTFLQKSPLRSLLFSSSLCLPLPYPPSAISLSFISLFHICGRREEYVKDRLMPTRR